MWLDFCAVRAVRGYEMAVSLLPVGGIRDRV
jgi:hypothetical protein